VHASRQLPPPNGNIPPWQSEQESWTLAADDDKTHPGNIIERRADMITWEMATILILVAYILGLMTAIRLLKS
jgi:hypothetical protein